MLAGRISLDRYRRPLGIAAGALVLAFAAGWECKVNLADLVKGIDRGSHVLRMFFPPAWDAVPELVAPALVTLLIALAATPIGAAFSILAALAAARTIAPPWIRNSARLLIAVERGTPEIVLALLLVCAFGPGPFAGVMALAVASVGMLGKLMADAIEEIDPGVLESVRATGASGWQVIRYAVFPEVLPALYANSIFRFDANIRASFLLGAIGAGGIGYEVHAAMIRLEFDRATIAVGYSLLVVFLAERMSDALRARLFAGGRLR